MSQARRLEELDRLYREEVVARKRAHNALQDAKGKIRVYCRVRPMLEFEAAKHQVSHSAATNAVARVAARGSHGAELKGHRCNHHICRLLVTDSTAGRQTFVEPSHHN